MAGVSLPKPPDVDKLLSRPPDDSIETRIIKRQGWTLQVAIGLAFTMLISAVGIVLYLQEGSQAACEEMIEDVRGDMHAAQAVLLNQINLRIDAHVDALTRCRSQTAELQEQLRGLEVEFREKIEELRGRQPL